MFVVPWPFIYSSIAFFALLSLLEQEVVTKGVPMHKANRMKSVIPRRECLFIIGILLTRRAPFYQAVCDEESVR